MKKIQLIGMAVVLMCVFSGCANYAKEYDNNTLVVKKNDSLVEIAIEDFKDSSVNAEELNSYIDEQIAAYNEKSGRSKVKKKSIDTENMGKVKLVLTYKNMESFNGFNTLNCTLQAFSDIEESKLAGDFQSAEGKSVKVSDMQDTDKAKVLIISEKTDVVIKGNILYYNEEVKVKDNVAATSGNEDAVIIYK